MFRELEIYNFGLSHATDFYDMPICSLFDVFDNQEGVAIALQVGFFFFAIIKRGFLNCNNMNSFKKGHFAVFLYIGN